MTPPLCCLERQPIAHFLPIWWRSGSLMLVPHGRVQRPLRRNGLRRSEKRDAIASGFCARIRCMGKWRVCPADHQFATRSISQSRRMAGLEKLHCGVGDCHGCLLWAVSVSQHRPQRPRCCRAENDRIEPKAACVESSILDNKHLVSHENKNSKIH